MSPASMRYRELPPSPSFANVLASFWEFVVGPVPAGFLHRIPLDGSASIGYCRPIHGPARVIFIGPRVTPLEVPVHPGDRYWGIRVLPGASGPALGKSGEQWRDQAGLLTEPWAAQLVEQLAIVETLEQAVPFLESVIRNGKPEPANSAAVQIILRSRGSERVAEIPAQIGLSDRQFLRVFRREVGMTPKQFSRICRVRAAALDALADSGNWGQIAAERGFSDQAHLANEFNRLFGITPTEFETRFLSEVAHGHIVE